MHVGGINRRCHGNEETYKVIAYQELNVSRCIIRARKTIKKCCQNSWPNLSDDDFHFWSPKHFFTVIVHFHFSEKKAFPEIVISSLYNERKSFTSYPISKNIDSLWL